MKVILCKNIPHLGYKGDKIEVAPGFFNNFLGPRGDAEIANLANRKRNQENQKQASHKIAQEKSEATKTAQQIEKLNLIVPAKIGTSGKIFGTITTIQISNLLKEHNLEINPRQIKIPQAIKEQGPHKVQIALYREVEATLSLIVEPIE